MPTEANRQLVQDAFEALVDNEEVRQPWLDRWLHKDYSWNGLSKTPSWASALPNLQAFLRSLNPDRPSDEQLLADGMLVDCGGYGLFHVLFVPPEWTMEGGPVDLSEKDLQSAQSAIWTSLRSSHLGDVFSGQISGVHLGPGDAALLIAGTRARFVWCSFHGPISGLPKPYRRQFEDCAFRERVELHEKVSVHQSSIAFYDCQFDRDLVIDGLEGVEEVSLEFSIISGRLVFRDVCGARIKIARCLLSGVDGFRCEFQDDVQLHQTGVSQAFSLSNCTFEGWAAIVASRLSGGIHFLDCDFKGRVSFANIEWPRPRRRAASAQGSKFFATVAFDSDHPPPIQFFQNAEFESKVSFSPISNARLRTAFYDELQVPPGADDSPDDRSQHGQAIENGCRTLRKLAESRGDVHQEHFWHRAEIIARRETGENTLSEKGFSYLYGWLADYGLSISRPFVVLGTSTLLFALFYAWIGGESWVGSIDLSSFQEGIGYSLNRTLPIGVFADEDNAWRTALLGSGGQLGAIAIRMIATTQTVLSAILIYLGVMAVRRTFRIS